MGHLERQTMSDDAKRFVRLLGRTELLPYEFLAKLQRSERSGDPDRFMNDWLGKLGYATDMESIRTATLDMKASDPGFWRGTYMLANEAGKMRRLTIKDSDKIYCDAKSIGEFTFAEQVLSWEEDGHASTVEFRDFADRKPADDALETSPYLGAVCEGEILFGEKTEHAKGKVGVFTPEAIRGKDGDHDPISTWFGHYEIHTQTSDGNVTHTLGIGTKEGQTVYTFDGEILNGDSVSYSAGTLKWSQNDRRGRQLSRAILNFGNTRFGTAWVLGLIETDAETSGARNSLGMRLDSASGGDVSDLQIKTENLPTTVAGSPFNVKLQAEGGTPPYVWKVEGLPGFLTLDGDWLRSEAVEETIASLVLKVTDAGSGKDTKVILAEFAKPPAAKGSTFDWISVFIPGLIVVALGVGLKIVSKRVSKALEERDARAAEAAERAGDPAVAQEQIDARQREAEERQARARERAQDGVTIERLLDEELDRKVRELRQAEVDGRTEEEIKEKQDNVDRAAEALLKAQEDANERAREAENAAEEARQEEVAREADAEANRGHE